MRDVSGRLRELRGIALRKRAWVELYLRRDGTISAAWGGAWSPRVDGDEIPFAVISPDGEIYERSRTLEFCVGGE